MPALLVINSKRADLLSAPISCTAVHTVKHEKTLRETLYGTFSLPRLQDQGLEQLESNHQEAAAVSIHMMITVSYTTQRRGPSTTTSVGAW